MINNTKKKKEDNKKLKKKPNALKKKKNASEKKNVSNDKKNEKPRTILIWIDLLKNLKLKQLRKNIDEEISNYEINKNINDKLLLFLNNDLEENAILEKIDELKNSKLSILVDIHKENMNNLQKQFEQDIYKMFNDFEEDQKILIRNRNSIIHNINLFYRKLEENQKERKTNLEKEELHMMDEIRKNYIAERYIANYKFEKFREEDNKTFRDLLAENKKVLNEERENYNSVKTKYERNKESLLSKEKEVLGSKGDKNKKRRIKMKTMKKKNNNKNKTKKKRETETETETSIKRKKLSTKTVEKKNRKTIKELSINS
ncbi:conserved Plasmodium protein, unknown function [Plasmodium malariae]|uniref:Uncharacterized protein n=1 Tax=Plasmodium malariae TaxID=5858 RepID=A0A1C3KM13_PLAMA|nr:conserved Plasmodium protein, unknown function [Plasmodium malariae]